MNIILNQLKKEAVILCPLCNKEYKPTDMQIVEDKGNVLLAFSSCPRCQSGILSLLYKDLSGVTLIGMVTDLNYEDAVKLKNQKKVTEDDALHTYQRLTSN